ncbi:hypothetical protein AC739_15610 [Planococcus glaciei]|uniref:DUF1643 domain-containing protein n=1 Tax=Planococcus glaciei TaxID=459472 RepID=UPI00069F92F4|nr:DUF1643 domain-containing protein [Planococcus glaciei]KOF09267.1 hypothetical protein AC739_15610 [Planococcus glaciei]
MAFIPAEVLKNVFNVSAKFYHADIDGERFLMRREARISRLGSTQNKIDAVVVMINPGSCQPTEALEYTPLGEMTMLPANADQTQHQLMRLMEDRGWNELTIVNLSDICEGNLAKFMAIEQKFNVARIPHSFFQDDNAEERNSLLANADHLIFAWGSSDNAKRLAKEYSLFKNGIPFPQYQNAIALIHPVKLYPLHPRPALVVDRVKWLQDMTDLLGDRVTV